VRNINLSGNVLHHLDGRFQVVLSLQRLHFCRNQLRVIDPSIAETLTLQVPFAQFLNCPSCSVPHPFPFTPISRHAQVLHLDHNELESLPYAMYHMPHLRVLTLSHNRLASNCIPEVIDESAHPVQLQARPSTSFVVDAVFSVTILRTYPRRWCSITTTWEGLLAV
jgi:hypothetical protein